MGTQVTLRCGAVNWLGVGAAILLKCSCITDMLYSGCHYNYYLHLVKLIYFTLVIDSSEYSRWVMRMEADRCEWRLTIGTFVNC
jgi:hypothetical protein